MLTRADGKVEARASDGSVLLDGIFQTVSASTADGRLEVKARPGSVVTDSWTIRTSDGRLFLSVPEDIQADFDLKTSDGRIHTDLPIAVTGRLSQNRLSGKMNGGGPLVSVQSSDGPIQISRTIE
jgi:hypothetical protein